MVQLLLRGLAMDVNALEEGDVKVGQQAADKVAIESRMSSAFMLLADEALPACPAVARECLLTAFSLKPSPELLVKLKSVATAGGDGAVQGHCCGNGREEGMGREGRGRREWSKVREKGGEMFDTACEKLVEDLKDYKGEELRKKLEGGGMLGIAAIQVWYLHKVLNLFKINLLVLLPYPYPTTFSILLILQAKSVTSLASYDPSACPLSPYQDGWPKCLPQGVLRDLLVVASCPRWHLLTWTVGWAELEQRAQVNQTH